MFEVITQTQPDDYQSLEILKDAYQKIGQPEESQRISRKLAEAYFNVGSHTLAMQECEVVLLKEPNSPEILAMLGDIEARLQAADQSIVSAVQCARTALLRLVYGTLGQMKSVEPIEVAVDHRFLPEREPNLLATFNDASFLGSIIARISPSKLRPAIPRIGVVASVA